MLGIHDFGVFVVAGILLNLSPGQDTIYIAGRSIAEGRRVGLASALGVATGGLLHVIAATIGLSVVLATSALAFAIVKWAGVAYLTYLGFMLLVQRTAYNPLAAPDQSKGVGIAYRRGVLTNVLNPKVALFFLAFLPQFIDPTYAHQWISFLLLGGTFLFTGTIWCLCTAVLAARTSAALRRSSIAATAARRITGGVFIGLGVKLALDEAR
jgi:threonine/homoserine/homoserine lactone efflux protein